MDPVAAQLLNWQPREQQMQQQAMVLQHMMAQREAQQRALAARAPAFGVLEQMGQQPQPQVPPPPMMGGPQAPPPGTLSPGGGNPQVMPPGGAPPQPGTVPPPPMAGGPAPAPPAAAPAPPPPFRPMPTAPAAGAGPGMVPPPPAAAPQPEFTPPAHIDTRKVIEQISKSVPLERRMDVLDQLMPVIQRAQQDELQFFRTQTAAQAAAIKAYEATIHQYRAETDARRADTTQQRADQQVVRDDQRHTEAMERNRIAERRMEAMFARLAGAQDNVKGVEYIYPKGADGKPDQEKAPIGTRGTTKTGKIIYMNAEGAQVPASELVGATAKEGKAGAGGAQAAVRSNLVKSGVQNSLARLSEIEKNFPNTNTSAFFGSHGDNPATRALYGAGRTMQSSDQKKADAAWASMIDEAIPVFTGGLRGSDAFRRFLIEQAPGPGDDKASRAEKIRLLKENINGTNKAFFEKFKSDPQMWASGTKPDDVQGGGAAPSGGAQQYTEGQTASGPGGKKIVFRGGQWQPVQ